MVCSSIRFRLIKSRPSESRPLITAFYRGGKNETIPIPKLRLSAYIITIKLQSHFWQPFDVMSLSWTTTMKFCGREMYQEVSRNGHTKGCVKMRKVFSMKRKKIIGRWCVTYPIDRRFSGPAFMTSKAPMAYCVKLKTAINSIGKVEMGSSQTF